MKPIANVVSIRQHPRFRSQIQSPETPNPESNPNQERDEYLHFLGQQEATDPFDNLEPAEVDRDPATPIPMTEPRFGGGSRWFGISVCAYCEHRRDFRPWYRRLLSRPKLTDLFCAVSPREEVLEPITGIVGYLPYGTKIPANAQPEPFDSCLTRNCLGTCPQFKPTRH